MRASASLTVTVLLLTTWTAHAKGTDTRAEAALEHLAEQIPTSGALVANIAEAAHLNGWDLGAWPSIDDPIANHLQIPPDGSTAIALLRPLRALAFAGHPQADADGNLTRRVLDQFDRTGYSDPATLNDDAYAILALRAVGFAGNDGRLQAPRNHLLAHQNADGGWGWMIGATSGTDLTGLVLEALDSSGGIPTLTATGAAAFLATTQVHRGFAETPGGVANCESSVWGLRATARLGQEARQMDWEFLLFLQQADGGFGHLPATPSDILCTSEAAGLLGEVRAGGLQGPLSGDLRIPSLGPGSVAVLLVAVGLVARRHEIRSA